jgi:hypothetical protein
VTGSEYSNLIASYLAYHYGDRGLVAYREISLGKSIIGKNRRIDVFLVHEPTQRALAIECKYQGTQGTVDEKIPYTLQDMEALRVPGAVVYAGDGFSEGVIHMLQASPMAVYCLPDEETLAATAQTRELDHIVAMTFQWWDLVIKGRKPFEVED